MLVITFTLATRLTSARYQLVGDDGESAELRVLVLSLKQGQDQIKGVLHRHETKQDSIVSAISELKEMMEKQLKSSFCLKAANLEVKTYII